MFMNPRRSPALAAAWSLTARVGAGDGRPLGEFHRAGAGHVGNWPAYLLLRAGQQARDMPARGTGSFSDLDEIS